MMSAYVEPNLFSGHSSQTRKPKLGTAHAVQPGSFTAFEVQARQLRLIPETYVYSNELRRWCEQNRNRYYIPEWLLNAWDMAVDPDLTTAT